MPRLGIRMEKYLDPGAPALSISSKAILHCREDQPVGDVIPLMLQNHRRLPVISQTGRYFRGVVSSSDILDFLGAGEKYLIYRTRFDGLAMPVGRIISQAAPLAENHTILEALRHFRLHGKGFHPVLENRKIAGVVTEWDFVKHINKPTGVKVSEAMTQKPVFLREHDTVLEAGKAMVRGGYRRLPVVSGPSKKGSAQQRLAGIATPRDILRHLSRAKRLGRLPRERTPVSHAMNPHVITITPEKDVYEAVMLMGAHRVNCLPVVNQHNGLAGIITEKDILDAMH